MSGSLTTELRSGIALYHVWVVHKGQARSQDISIDQFAMYSIRILRITRSNGLCWLCLVIETSEKDRVVVEDDSRAFKFTRLLLKREDEEVF